MLPIALQNLFIGYLQLKKRFLEATIIPGILNLVIVLFMLTLAGNNVYILSFGMVFGYFLVLLLFVIVCKTEGLRYTLYCDLKESYIKEMFFLVIPVFLSTGASQINGIVDKTFASMLEGGCVSALNYAEKINVIISTFSVSTFIAVLYPILSRMADGSEQKKFCEYVEKNILFIIMLVLPMMIVCVTLSRDIISLLFGHGKFTDDNVKISAQCLIAYSVGFIGYTLRAFLIRVFYACHNSKIPSRNTIIALVFNIVFNILLFNKLKHIGLALATATASNLTTVLLMYELNKIRKDFKILHIVKDVLKMVIAGAIMMGLMFKLNSLMVWNFALLKMCLNSTIGIVVYFIVLLLLKAEIVITAIKQFKNKLGSITIKK
jgi:putative peptidoglycan lipid II flippase